jgi:hypothetical protein
MARSYVHHKRLVAKPLARKGIACLRTPSDPEVRVGSADASQHLAGWLLVDLQRDTRPASRTLVVEVDNSAVPCSRRHRESNPTNQALARIAP